MPDDPRPGRPHRRRPEGLPAAHRDLPPARRRQRGRAPSWHPTWSSTTCRAYVMISCSVERGTVVPPASEWTPETAAGDAGDSMLRALEGWHPAARALVEGMDLDSMFVIPFGFLEPAEDWDAVTGDDHRRRRPRHAPDARHGRQPVAQRRRAPRRPARPVRTGARSSCSRRIGAYEAAMREVAYPILRMTLRPRQELRRRRPSPTPRRACGTTRERSARRQGRPHHRDRRRDRPGHGRGLSPARAPTWSGAT